MPRRNKRSRQAQLQRQNGSTFGSGLQDDPIGRRLDPDFVPSVTDADSDLELDVNTFEFALTTGTKEVSVNESDESDSESGTDSDEGEEVESNIMSKKRALEEGDSDSDTEYGDAEIRCALDALHERKDKRPPAKQARTLTALPTYTGAGKSSIFKKQADLRHASEGSKKIDSFFTKPVNRTSESTNPMSTVIPPDSSAEHLFCRGQNLTNALNEAIQAAIAAQPTCADTPSPSHEDPPVTQPSAETRIPDWVAELEREGELLTAPQLLDMTADDELEPPNEPVYNVVKRLIGDAKKHQSYGALFKLEAIKNYLELRVKYSLAPKVMNPAMRASYAVANAVGRGPYFARQIRHLALYVQHFKMLPPTGSGRHHAHPSLLNNERILQAVRRYLTAMAPGEITPHKLQREVNTVIIPSLGLNLGGTMISERCAVRWLHKLGYGVSEVKKGIYVDGHERPDVVKDRGGFVDGVFAKEHLRRQYRDEDLEPVDPQLPPDEKLHVPLHHDECIVRCNDLERRVWKGPDGKMPLRKKGQGRSIHISDFIVEHTGRVTLPEAERQKQKNLPPDQRVAEDAREIIYPGKNSDGWWTCERLIEQVKKTIPLFERLYPGAVGEFFFDQSSAHGAFASNSLNANEMNVKPGGKQRVMHATVIPDSKPHPELRGKPQSMVFDSNLPPSHEYYEFRGQAKGMRVVLEERGLWDDLCTRNGRKSLPGDCKDCKMSAKAKDQHARERAAEMAGQDEEEEADDDRHLDSISLSCCMRKVLLQQDDFRAEKPLLQIIIEEAGHKCYFIPKFHCELNPIEMYWGWVKMRYRTLADGSWATAKKLVPELLDSCEAKTIRAFYRKCWRYMDAYRKGLNVRQAEFAVKKYRSHRRVPARVMMDLEAITCL